MKGIQIITIFIFMSVLAACSDTAEELAEGDGFSIGYIKMTTESKVTGEEFPVALLYPSKTPSEYVKFGPFEMELSIAGKMATGKFPLAIISHGSGGSNLGHRSIAFALVKQGFVVGIPLHPKNNFKNNDAEGKVSNWINRPLHLSAAIDAILSNPKISDNIDADKIAVIGHSSGGYAALAVAGGTADTSHIIDLCLNHPDVNAPFCGLVKDNKIKAVKIPNLPDERVKAIVLMAPVGVLFKSEDALDKVDIPMFLLRAEKDTVLSEPYQSDIIAQNYKNKDLLTYCTVANAGHYSFITPFPKEISSELGPVAQDPEGFERDKFHQLLSADIVNFLGSALNKKYDKMRQPSAYLSCSSTE